MNLLFLHLTETRAFTEQPTQCKIDISNNVFFTLFDSVMQYFETCFEQKLPRVFFAKPFFFFSFSFCFGLEVKAEKACLSSPQMTSFHEDKREGWGGLCWVLGLKSFSLSLPGKYDENN